MKSSVLVYLMLPVLLVGCATQERRNAVDRCQSSALRMYPYKFERMLVTKNKTIQVPTGDVTCTRYGNVTQCDSQMRTEYIPYTAIDNVDVNRDLREAEAKSCADSFCLSTYQNRECKPAR